MSLQFEGRLLVLKQSIVIYKAWSAAIGFMLYVVLCDILDIFKTMGMHRIQSLKQIHATKLAFSQKYI